MTAFSPALDRIAAVQLALSITTPIAQSIQRVYRVAPKQSNALPTSDLPCWINSVDLPEVHFMPNAQRTRTYVVSMQLVVGDAENDQAREIALSFLEAAVVAFHNDLTLEGAAPGGIELRGGSPTLAQLDWAGKSFVGLQLFLDVRIYDTGVAGP